MNELKDNDSASPQPRALQTGTPSILQKGLLDDLQEATGRGSQVASCPPPRQNNRFTLGMNFLGFWIAWAPRSPFTRLTFPFYSKKKEIAN